ncbi:hypothetical protein VNO77_04764 [Canavalia gladiata]|uniref:Autophagy-related protein 2 n=1 Tax=Canavalia gladiata TaxID=3824 RepID=A0AAN9R819_CANGL
MFGLINLKMPRKEFSRLMRVSVGLGKSAAVLVQNPLKEFQRGSGAGPALAAAVRAVPAAALAPASACASAVQYALLGLEIDYYVRID